MFTFSYFRAVFTVICFRYSVSLECYNCSNITNVNTCGTITTCPSGQSCYLDFSNTAEYTLGCIENQKCGALPHVSASLVGRNLNGQEQNIVNDRRDLAKRETGHCFECCSFDICNRVLCAHLKPTICIDDPKVDCAWLNSKFNICQIVHEAKTVCPKFCGLCTLVDGNWGDWSPWGKCDVTCENGTQTRVRHCNNPSPVNGGLNCSGSDLEQKPCALQTCPIDGNWDSWSFWSSCDVTCLNGTQTRTRSCNNPAPAYNGRNCSGNSLEYKQCMNDVCPVHGGWTQWLPWEACSVTCDIGIQHRHRNCSNPIPQNAGHYCFGDPVDVEMCMPGSCADGGWSTWSSWSACSLTCGAGIKSRSRTCTSPRPSVLGRQCDGDPNQIISCNSELCSVAFQAHDLAHASYQSPGTFVFSIATLNFGNAYNTVTGIFTAPFAGTYFFSTQICIQSTYSDWVVFHISHNGNHITGTYARGDKVNVACYTAAASAVLHVNDTVQVVHSVGDGTLYQDSDIWNMFSGSLQHF